jgi:hypothetical protein
MFAVSASAACAAPVVAAARARSTKAAPAAKFHQKAAFSGSKVVRMGGRASPHGGRAALQCRAAAKDAAPAGGGLLTRYDTHSSSHL